MEKVYKAGIAKSIESNCKVYKGCITSKLNTPEQVIDWLPINLITDKDMKTYNYFIDEEGDLSRKRKSA